MLQKFAIARGSMGPGEGADGIIDAPVQRLHMDVTWMNGDTHDRGGFQ
jgi:hypothetical protein